MKQQQSAGAGCVCSGTPSRDCVRCLPLWSEFVPADADPLAGELDNAALAAKLYPGSAEVAKRTQVSEDDVGQLSVGQAGMLAARLCWRLHRPAGR